MSFLLKVTAFVSDTVTLTRTHVSEHDFRGSISASALLNRKSNEKLDFR